MENLKHIIIILPTLLILMMLLGGCKTTNSNACPSYPIGGPKVFTEINRGCEKNIKKNCPHIEDWLVRLGVLQTNLEECKK